MILLGCFSDSKNEIVIKRGIKIIENIYNFRPRQPIKLSTGC